MWFSQPYWYPTVSGFARLQAREDERHRLGIQRASREPVLLRDGVALLGGELLHRLAGEHARELRPRDACLRTRRLPRRILGEDRRDGEGLVGVDQRARGEGHAARLLRVVVVRVHLAACRAAPARRRPSRIRRATREVHLTRPPRHVRASRIRHDELRLRRFGAEPREVDQPDPAPAREDVLVAFRRVLVVVEVQRLASRLGAQPDDAMSRRGIDPVARWLVGEAKRSDGGGAESENGEETHAA